MSSRLRGVRAQEAVKAFERAGGIVRPGKGDHINIKMPNGRIITFRARGEVKIGLLKDAIKESGLKEEEFLDLLR